MLLQLKAPECISLYFLTSLHLPLALLIIPTVTFFFHSLLYINFHVINCIDVLKVNQVLYFLIYCIYICLFYVYSVLRLFSLHTINAGLKTLHYAKTYFTFLRCIFMLYISLKIQVGLRIRN